MFTAYTILCRITHIQHFLIAYPNRIFVFIRYPNSTLKWYTTFLINYTIPSFNIIIRELKRKGRPLTTWYLVSECSLFNG